MAKEQTGQSRAATHTETAPAVTTNGPTAPEPAELDNIKGIPSIETRLLDLRRDLDELARKIRRMQKQLARFAKTLDRCERDQAFHTATHGVTDDMLARYRIMKANGVSVRFLS